MSKVTGCTAAPNVLSLGSYTYIQAPVHSAATVNGTLTRGGRPVTLRETEPILRDFLDVLGELQDDFTRRWGAIKEWPVLSRAE
ncbi:hypothetical protein AB0G32_06970 [Streptomyces sp. NPDC023723]|uniref:hypothetical protein n=1 Tax=Streptomyces sp. NPDC023723 TaxID=3154323 RepID=UPI0033ED1B6F